MRLHSYSRTATASISIRKSLLARVEIPIHVLVGKFFAGKKLSKASRTDRALWMCSPTMYKRKDTISVRVPPAALTAISRFSKACRACAPKSAGSLICCAGQGVLR